MTLSLFIPSASSLRSSSLHTRLSFFQVLKAPSFFSPTKLSPWLAATSPQTTPKCVPASSLSLTSEEGFPHFLYSLESESELVALPWHDLTALLFRHLACSATKSVFLSYLPTLFLGETMNSQRQTPTVSLSQHLLASSSRKVGWREERMNITFY